MRYTYKCPCDLWLLWWYWSCTLGRQSLREGEKKCPDFPYVRSTLKHLKIPRRVCFYTVRYFYTIGDSLIVQDLVQKIRNCFFSSSDFVLPIGSYDVLRVSSEVTDWQVSGLMGIIAAHWARENPRMQCIYLTKYKHKFLHKVACWNLPLHFPNPITGFSIIRHCTTGFGLPTAPHLILTFSPSLKMIGPEWNKLSDPLNQNLKANLFNVGFNIKKTYRLNMNWLIDDSMKFEVTVWLIPWIFS